MLEPDKDLYEKGKNLSKYEKRAAALCCFFGAEKCFAKLNADDKCIEDCILPFALAGGNKEIIKKFSDRKKPFNGNMKYCIRYHRNDILEEYIDCCDENDCIEAIESCNEKAFFIILAHRKDPIDLSQYKNMLVHWHKNLFMINHLLKDEKFSKLTSESNRTEIIEYLIKYDNKKRDHTQTLILMINNGWCIKPTQEQNPIVPAFLSLGGIVKVDWKKSEDKTTRILDGIDDFFKKN